MGTLVRLLLATLLIGGAWLTIRRSTRHRLGSGRQLEVLARLGLAKGVSVAVVRIAGRGLVLGVSDRGVCLVAELSGDALEDLAAHASGAKAAGAANDPEADAVDPEADAVEARSSTHAAMGPRTGLVQRLQRMTLRTNLPAATGRQAPRLLRGPVRAKKSA